MAMSGPSLASHAVIAAASRLAGAVWMPKNGNDDDAISNCRQTCMLLLDGLKDHSCWVTHKSGHLKPSWERELKKLMAKEKSATSHVNNGRNWTRATQRSHNETFSKHREQCNIDWAQRHSANGPW